MNWEEMEANLTAKAQAMLFLRDKISEFKGVLDPVADTISYQNSFSLKYGFGVDMTVTSPGGRVVRMHLYPTAFLAYLGTKEYQGTEAPFHDHSLPKEVLDYMGVA